MDWRIRSKCANLTVDQADKLFFPDSGRSINKAKSFCNNCPVLKKCLDFALTHELQGIWAGTNEAERRKILRFRDQLNAPVVVTRQRVVRRVNVVFN